MQYRHHDEESVMRESLIDASDVSGSTSSVTIFMTTDYHPNRTGASVAHGRTTDSGRKVHIDFVDLTMPGVILRVRADVVRKELGALYAAHQDLADDAARSSQHAAFEALQAAMWAAAGRLVRTQHIEAVARQAYEEGICDGRESLQLALRLLLGLQRR